MNLLEMIILIAMFVVAIEFAGRLLYFVKTGKRGGDIPFSYVPDALRRIEGSGVKKTKNGYVYHK